MMNCSKYHKQYYMPPVECLDWARKDSVEKAPGVVQRGSAGTETRPLVIPYVPGAED